MLGFYIKRSPPVFVIDKPSDDTKCNFHWPYEFGLWHTGDADVLYKNIPPIFAIDKQNDDTKRRILCTCLTLSLDIDDRLTNLSIVIDDIVMILENYIFSRFSFAKYNFVKIAGTSKLRPKIILL